MRVRPSFRYPPPATASVPWSKPSRNGNKAFARSIAAALVATSTPAAAQVAGEVALQSDYRDRGFSLSGEEPAVSLGVSYDDPSGLYIGGFASGSWLDGAPRLVGAKVYAGHTIGFAGGVTADLGIVQTHYSSASILGRAADFTELYAGVATRHVSAHVFYSPDYWNFGIPSIYAQLDGGVDLAESLTLSGHVGYLAYPEQPATRYVPDRQDWRVGLARPFGKVTLQANLSGRLVRGDSQDIALTVGLLHSF